MKKKTELLLISRSTERLFSTIIMIKDTRRVIVDEMHRQARKKFKRRKYKIIAKNETWQADLMIMDNFVKYNKGYKYVLLVIDIFSKFVWLRALKTKKASEVASAFNSIISKSKVIPKNLCTDQGTEFYGKEFRNLMQKHSINHYSVFSNLKAAIAERAIRTIKSIIWKNFAYNANYRYVDSLDDVAKQYNNSPHRTLGGLKPSKIGTRQEEFLKKNVYRVLKVYKPTKFKIGDQVRISRVKNVFAKGYTPSYTSEIFTIAKIHYFDVPVYTLKDYTGDLIRGNYTSYPTIKK